MRNHQQAAVLPTARWKHRWTGRGHNWWISPRCYN